MMRYRPAMTTNLVLLLAQLCVAEIGFPQTQAHLDECQLMWAINDDRADRWRADPTNPWAPGFDIANVSWLYNSVFKCEQRTCDTPRMKWVRRLNMQATKPRGWPESAGPWVSRRHRTSWRHALAAARRWLDAGRPWPRVRRGCRHAIHYGGAMDKPRPCWQRVACGDWVRQRYYAAGTCS